MPQLDRSTQDPQVMGGKACVRGMRVTVGLVGQMLPATPSRKSSRNTRIWNARMCFKPFAAPPGSQKIVKSRCPVHEAACRVAGLGRPFPEVGMGSRALVRRGPADCA